MVKIEDFFELKYSYDGMNIHTHAIINYDYIYSIPEFAKLKTLKQSPKWHSESEYIDGHVNAVINECVNYIKTTPGRYTPKDIVILLLASIFHDVGKANTTFFKESDNSWHHYGHEIESEKITRRILWDIGEEIREPVCQLVGHHMEPMNIMKCNNVIDRMIDLSYKVPSIDLLCLLKYFDMKGSIPANMETTKNDQKILDSFFRLATSLNILYEPSYSHKAIKEYKHLTSNKPEVLVNVYIGLPGAGKDTHIYNSLTENQVVVCRDDIRAELGYCKEGEKYVGTKEEEDNVTKVFNNKILKAASEGKNIILNNMNIKRKYRDDYKRILKDYNAYFHYIVVEASCLEKNIERRKGQIDENVFYKMIESFEYPTVDEYDTIEIIHT